MKTTPLSILFADLVHPANAYKTFPYAAGCVAAHTQASLGHEVAVEVFRATEELGTAFRRQRPPILAFSNYLWNLELEYEAIRRAKALVPATVVVMGGPNYPTDAGEQRAFLQRYPLIDFYVVKEGEVPFVELVRRLLDRGLDGEGLKNEGPNIAGVHYLCGDELVAPPPMLRERDLDHFPSPYLAGLLDKFFCRRDLAPLVQTKRGCPFECTFCVEGEAYYTKLGSVTAGRFRAELEYMAAHAGNGSPLLHIADSNFGMYASDLEICDVIAEVRERTGWPQTIEVSTGKNRKERVLEAVRRSNGAIRFGPALQSTDRHTLENIKRSNISETILMEMAGAAVEMGQRSYTELILGLPGDTVASHARSIRAAMDAGMQRIKMYPLVLLPGTEMAGRASREQFGLETRFRVLPRCQGVYRFLDDTFPSVEPCELVIATDTMSFREYLDCKRFELSVEIFYNDVYFPEIHGLLRGLGLSMFDFVERCHARFERFPHEVKALYESLESGVRDNLFDSREACLAHFADASRLDAYVRDEYKNSLGTLKAMALLDNVEPLLAISRAVLLDCVHGAAPDQPSLVEYVDELVEYCRLRRQHILDTTLAPVGNFRFAFDRILEREFQVDPHEFRLPAPRTMRFWHDEQQTRDIKTLLAEIANPVVRARTFMYPPSDPGVSPYLRRARFF